VIELFEKKIDLTQYLFPPIAGFWKRLAAFIIDVVILAAIGQIIGWSASSFWFSVGPYGRFLGLAIVLVYFGLTYSRLFNGQTIGKRIFKLTVRDIGNKSISIRRSFLRISILVLPWLLNGWAVPFLRSEITRWFVILIVFGLGSVILYTFFFNRTTGQGLHDIICGTYVVSYDEEPIVFYPEIASVHKIVSAILIGFTLLWPA
jgi:uncharacterized RDD family membrane protein YckC